MIGEGEEFLDERFAIVDTAGDLEVAGFEGYAKTVQKLAEGDAVAVDIDPVDLG